MFMNTDQFRLIADSLDKKKPNDVSTEFSLLNLCMLNLSSGPCFMYAKSMFFSTLVDMFYVYLRP